MKFVRSLSTMKSTIDCVDSAWVTFLRTSLPCPATVGPYAVWPSCSRRSITGCHREPSWQPPCTSTKVYEFSAVDCGHQRSQQYPSQLDLTDESPATGHEGTGPFRSPLWRVSLS